MSEGVHRGYVEDRKRIFPLIHTAGGKDDAYEVDACVAQEWK